MDYTFATVIVAAADQATAQTLLENTSYFTAGFSEAGELPVTHYVSSGPFSNTELDLLVNDTTFQKKVLFGREVRTDDLKPVPPQDLIL